MEQHLHHDEEEQESKIEVSSSAMPVSQQTRADESAEIDRLLAVIAREAKGRWWRVICRGYLTFFVLAIIGFIITEKLGCASRFGLVMGPLCIMSFPVGFTAWASRRQKDAAAQLAQIDDLRVVGAMLSARFYISAELQN